MNRREYDYDAAGNPAECRYLDADGNVLKRYTYRWVYDGAGRVTEYEQDDVAGSVVVEWYAYEYDGQGRLTTRTQLEAGGDMCILDRYEYDGAGRLLRDSIYNAAGELSVVLEYAWR